MATIRKIARESGTVYQAYIRKQGHKPLTKTFKTRNAAERWARKTEAAIDEDTAGLTNEGQKHTLGSAIERYRRELLPNRNPSTQPNYNRHLDYWARELGHLKLATLSAAEIARCRDALAATPIPPKKPGGESKQRTPATVRRYLATLEAVLTACVREWHWLSVSPVKAVKKPEGADNKRTRFLSRDELARLLEACKASESPDLYLAVILAVTTGARRSELMGLRWRDLNLEQQVLSVRTETANSVKGGTRSLPIPPQAVALLKARQSALRQHSNVIEIKARDDEAAALVFPSRVTAKQPVDLRRPFTTALARAGIEGLRWHDLRHSAASFLAESGASLLEIGAVLGHKQAQTSRRYAHLTEKTAHARVLAVANDLLSQS
ncbi:integrase [Lamprobacter modestohalophilus]|uniref:Integrase n=1 Tax=Lamprobacter modestohalophilus TaxID=1064514 RepID=A0A9X0W600_9GAMM|nr:site-specific integrase [Lamprobacter modestohalophilus]MBK1617603.1 integrase [Lamprobacter modestohalophilus]